MRNVKIHYPALIAAVIIYLFCYPYFAWGMCKSGYPLVFLKIILFFLFLANLDLKGLGRRFLLLILFGLFVVMQLSIGGNIFGVLSSVILCTIPFGNEFFSRKTFDYYLDIYSFIICISGIVWLFSLVGAVPSMGTIAPLNELKAYNYLLYPFLVKYNSFNEISRFSGPFDEPGVVGTLSILILTIGKFNLKDKRNLIVFITGFLSLSFFYYFYIILYYIFYFIKDDRHKKKGFIFLGILVLFVILTLNNEIMYTHLWQRFEWDSDSGSLQGDNRIGVVGKDIFDSILSSREFYFGAKDYAYLEELLEYRASLLLSILQYGFICVSIYIGIFLYYGWRYRASISNYVFVSLVLLGTLFQRPFFYNPEFLFLFSLLAKSSGDYLLSPNLKLLRQ